MKELLWELSYKKNQAKEKAWMWLVWKLPETLIKWAAIRLIAHATTNKYAATVVPELTALDALGRWRK
jgi:hypothetical protein